jgi:hypothetical protein
MDEEIWLRRMLHACHDAVDRLRGSDRPDAERLIPGLRKLCGRLFKRLLALRSGTPRARA